MFNRQGWDIFLPSSTCRSANSKDKRITWHSEQNPFEERCPRNPTASNHIPVHVAVTFPRRDCLQTRRLSHRCKVLTNSQPAVASHAHSSIAPFIFGRRLNDVVTIVTY